MKGTTYYISLKGNFVLIVTKYITNSHIKNIVEISKSRANVELGILVNMWNTSSTKQTKNRSYRDT